MSVIFDQNSERGFVYGSLLEFMKCWENGANSRLVLESCNGYAWMNLTCCLGRPWESHVKKKSKYREEKDNARAADFNEKMREKDENVCDVTDASEKNDEIVADKNDEIEAVKHDETTIEGFVDCSISVKSSDFYYTMDKHEELNEALNVVVSKYLSDEFPDVEISKIDFSTRHTNEWYYHKPEKAVARDHKFRVNFKQKGKEQDLSEKDFSDEMKNLMKAQTLVPIPAGKKFILLGQKEKVKLEQLVLVANNR